MKLYIALTFICICSITYSQVGINTDTPTDGTALDINVNDKGILIPKVSLSGNNSLTGIDLVGVSLEEGVLVYNTNVVTGTNAINEGFYYWNGTDEWIALGNDADWSLDGNTLTSSDRLGSTNFIAVVVKTGNTDRFRFETNGTLRSVGNGTETSPSYSFVNSTNSGIYLSSSNLNLTFTSNGDDFLAHQSFGSSSQITFNPDGDPNMNLQIRGDSGVILNANPDRENIMIGNNSNPDYASLALAHSNKGFLPNRISIASLSNSAPLVSSPVDGVMAYNTSSSSNTEGMYVWDGRWKKFYTNAESLIPQFTGYNIGSSTNRYGTIFLTNTPDVSSDRRLKDNIIDVSVGLDEVLQMRPVSYYLKSDKTKNQLIGFIAQEMKELIPDVVETDENGMLSMRYSELIPVLTKAIQEQQAIIADQKSEISTLEERIARLEKIVLKK
ncbi:endosialidase-like protein [Nonlabens dokdonensis]|uniref:Endosialidase-like protein n=2 Tax=Nonlabens dokdonensis TaxID=328515 RepID=A0ABX5PY71_9FLAO|nr:tail fiber domain-containing protein [Nonlabens dokdonensis]AGC77333.1 putative phage tail protein [Nonlabens dokdonensis DSW-6]PZX40861.1 endosialidase-like protein [Nonlabens dokdonensis]